MTVYDLHGFTVPNPLRHPLFRGLARSDQGAGRHISAEHPRPLLPVATARYVDGFVRGGGEDWHERLPVMTSSGVDADSSRPHWGNHFSATYGVYKKFDDMLYRHFVDNPGALVFPDWP